MTDLLPDQKTCTCDRALPNTYNPEYPEHGNGTLAAAIRDALNRGDLAEVARLEVGADNGRGRRTLGHGGDKRAGLWPKAMGIDWMTRQELTQAIPPAYTEHIGHYLMAEINARREVAA